MQIKKADVCFINGTKNYSFSCGDIEVNEGDKVIVETARGLELGTVVSVCEIEQTEQTYDLKPVLRIATERDIKIKNDNIAKEKVIKDKTDELVKSLKLDMKIINAELSFDGAKVVINFTADDRIDFRELVKELASNFRTRIELRQIGSRDETKVIGGLGPCGRQCCCNLFLKDFEHSSIKMAKTQNLSLNPTKISGLCGRLMCCLAYENEYYSEMQKVMPKINEKVRTPQGDGFVIYNNLLGKKVQVKLMKSNDTTEIKEFELSEISRLNFAPQDNKKDNDGRN